MPKSRSLKDLILEEAGLKTNPGGSGPDNFQSAPDQSQAKESFIGGVVKSAVVDKASGSFSKGTKKARKADPKISILDEFQFGAAEIRDDLLDKAKKFGLGGGSGR